MCIGNRASTSAYYINKQLETLWKISTECVAKHGHGLKPTKTEVEYGSSLAQICVGKHSHSKPCKEDLAFFTAFGAPPTLKFICNHEVVLQFHLTEGHYKLEGNRSLELFENYTCSFRVQYHEHLIKDSSFGQTESCKTKLLILDLNTATFLREHSHFAEGNKFGSDEVDRKHAAIVKYLTKHYLPLLRKAGFHCIYSLPDFDNLSRTHHIDYSVISEVDIEVTDIFGVNIDVINTFLKGRWLEAAACVDEIDDDHDHSLFGEFALAEHRGICDDISFHAFFGPPHIRALCSKEVVFYVDVHDLQFYLEGGFHGTAQHQVSDWRIAVVVGVHFVEEEGGCVRRLKLDFTKSRFCESRSICSSETIEETLLVKLRTVFAQYITERYLTILEEFHHHQIYHVDIRVVEVEEEYHTDDEELVEFSSEFRERLCITDTFGFDTVTSVTQGSINNHLRYLWKASQSSGNCIANWALEEYFGASFGAPQIQFPCDTGSNTVIFHLDLREGYLTSLGPSKKCIGGEKHSFAGWKLAFEVTLKLRDYTKSHFISDGYLKERDSVGEFILKQLVLDFSTVRFRQDLSRLPGLFDDSNYRLMRSKREALLHYITRFYFDELKHDGHHVLYTIPTRKPGGACGVIKYAPSSFAFQFYPSPIGESGNVISCLYGRNRSYGDRNMLVMCGMLDHSLRPSFPLPRSSWRWASDSEASWGSFSLSRKVFLEGWLLREFMRINQRTTLVPIFHGIGDGGEWRLELVRWEDHRYNKERPCHWREVQGCEEGLEFEWRNVDEWTYAHYGESSDEHNGGYSVSCVTTNGLIIPTVSRHGACEIKLSGKVKLTCAFKGVKKSWSTQATAKWDAIISLTSGGQAGLKVETSSSQDFSEFSGFVGDYDVVHPKFKDACTFLKEELGSVTIIEEATIRELDVAFAGVWPLFYSGAHGYTLCNPIFNSCGDLLFDLLSPLDRQGRILAKGGTRSDICLPSRKNTISHQIHVSETSYNGGEASLLTSRTGIDSPLRTPPLDYGLSSSGEKVRIRGEQEEIYGYNMSEETIHTGTTKLEQRTVLGGLGSEYEDNTSAVGREY